MVATPNKEMLDAFADDLLEEHSARTLVIVGAALMDHLLREILRQHLLPKTAKQSDSDELLEGDRPLSTFSSRIKLSYRLGLIDETLYRSVDTVRSLRNPCAHSVEADLEKSPLREHFVSLRKLVSTRESYAWTKSRYFSEESLQPIHELQCLLLTICVLLEAVRSATTETRGNPETLSMSAK